ncbi:Transposon Ty3-G Gag-Pol polyprotein [Vitis vinifera]|uniref:Transposon Ty3-G Gag-Pol polyprotein n=1 Tax=Vitis vinifera TaxID=29760 RepID=A0A438GQE4_VITVI|nr:Transposon Ty3-G Gag-Pol polyprotein [Vitis vinifera]
MGTLIMELLIGPTTFPTLFQVLRIPTSFNLLLGRPWIYRAEVIPSSLHQKVKFIHDRKVIMVQSLRNMFASSELVLQISHSEDDLFLTGFTFDEVQTLEVEDFCRDFVAMSFDQYSSMVVLDMMRGMSFMPGMGLRQRQHEPMEFVATVNHDTPFRLGFVPIEDEFGNYFVRGSEVHPHMGDFGTVTDIDGVDELQLVEPTGVTDGVVPRDEYRDEMDMMSMSQIVEMVQPEPASPFDLFRMSVIEVVEEIQIVLTPELMEDVTVGDDFFEDTFSSIEGASDFVDPPLSFDILSGFISCSDDVYDSVSIDLNPIDERVSPAIGDVEIVDFGIEDQPRKLKIVVEYPKWLANVIPIPKKDGKVTVCVDFKDLNKANLKDDFPLPHIDLLVDSIASHLMLSFMDGFFEYNQILMALEDMEKTTFIIECSTYCCRVMLFGLKNAGATYQRAATTLFHDMMHNDVEAYVNDMIVKSLDKTYHLATLKKFFERIWKFRLRVNPKKCTFGVTFGKLLRHMVSERGIKVDLNKIKAILGMPVSRTEKEIRGFLVAQLDDSGKKWAIYYLSKRMLDNEMRYVVIKHLYLALVWATKRLKHHMTEYSVHLICRLDPLRYLFDIPALTGRLMRWPVLLTEFDIRYVSQKSIKGSIIVDHLALLPISEGRPVNDDFPDEEFIVMTSLSCWRMYFDGVANHSGCGIGVLLISP